MFSKEPIRNDSENSRRSLNILELSLLTILSVSTYSINIFHDSCSMLYEWYKNLFHNVSTFSAFNEECGHHFLIYLKINQLLLIVFITHNSVMQQGVVERCFVTSLTRLIITRYLDVKCIDLFSRMLTHSCTISMVKLDILLSF